MSDVTIKSISDLNEIGINITPKLIRRVISEVRKRLKGKRDGVLHESLADIVINKVTAMRLEEEI